MGVHNITMSKVVFSFERYGLTIHSTLPLYLLTRSASEEPNPLGGPFLPLRKQEDILHCGR